MICTMSITAICTTEEVILKVPSPNLQIHENKGLATDYALLASEANLVGRWMANFVLPPRMWYICCTFIIRGCTDDFTDWN